MQTPKHYIGMDIASDTFTTAIFTPMSKTLFPPITLPNDGDGFDQLMRFLKEQKIEAGASVVCLENTGVYSEHLCYFLSSHGYSLAVEAPHKVKRAFTSSLRKNDQIDSQQIAEYAYRFFDQLTFWRPPEDLLEQVKALLCAREQFTRQMTANQNALKALLRKYVKTPLAEKTYHLTIDHLKEQIRSIDREIKDLISGHPTFGPMAALVMSVPGVGLLLAANLMVLTQGFTRSLQARQVASHVGICPFEHQSGTSVYKKPRSRHYGPARLRKLLYLAALSLRTHNRNFQHYFLRKVEEGKSKRLVLNNIANKLLKIIFSILKSRIPFIPNYRSVHPMFLKKT